jgi:hypothetical protein
VPFRVETRPVSRIEIVSLCTTDSTRVCVTRTHTQEPWHILFTVANPNVMARDWTFDIDLVGPDSTMIPLEHGMAGPRLQPGVLTTMSRPSPYRFGAADIGKWNVILTVTAFDPAGQDTSVDRRSASLFVDTPTGTLLSLFSATASGEAIEIRWRFAEPHGIATVELERGAEPGGPWARVPSPPVQAGETWTVIDRDVEPGRTHHYRLIASTTGGERLVFGPVASAVSASVARFALSPVMPNPSLGRVRVRFAVPRAAPVRLSVVDVQGREVAVLTEGLQPPGEHDATWNGRTPRGDAPAGLYFVRYQTPEGILVRRLVLTR